MYGLNSPGGRVTRSVAGDVGSIGAGTIAGS